MDLAPIIDRVAVLVHRDPTDQAVIDAVEAAAQFVATAENLDLSRLELEGPGYVALEDFNSAAGFIGDIAGIPDTPLYRQGMVGFARALYVDVLASRGAAVALGDQVVDTVYTPEDLYRHWRHYFAPLATSWGVA